MLTATFSSAKQLRAIAEAIHDLVHEVNIYVDSDGLSIQAMDTSHICLITVNLSSQDFDVYECDENMTLGVNVSSLIKSLKCAGPDDRVKLSCTSEDALHLEFVSDEARAADFELKLMTIEAERFEIPPVDSPIRFTMAAPTLARAIKDLSTLGDTLLLSMTKDDVTLTCEGDIGRATISFGSVCDEVKLRHRFSLKHFVSIAKAAVLTDDVTLELVADMPIGIEYAITSRSSVKFHLAPKMDEDYADI